MRDEDLGLIFWDFILQFKGFPPIACPISAEGKNTYSKLVWAFSKNDKPGRGILFPVWGFSLSRYWAGGLFDETEGKNYRVEESEFTW
jgi:hypothetical protein